MKLSLLLLAAQSLTSLAPSIASAAEGNTVVCGCKCVGNWFSSNLTITPADAGLSEDATAYDVMAASGLVCQNFCKKDTGGDFGYRSGMCRVVR